MSDIFRASRILPKAPREYDVDYMNGLVLQLQDLIRQMQTPGPFFCTTLNIAALPTSGNGLRAGDLFNDGGRVTVVEAGTAYGPSFHIETHIGSVTVTTS